jgi:hypothetical protein
VARRTGGAITLALLLTMLLATDAIALSWRSTITMTAGGSGWAYSGGLAVSSSTTAHAILERYTVDRWEVLYRKTTNSGVSWAAPVRLSRAAANESGSPVIDASGAGVNAAWLEGDDLVAGLDTVVVARNSTDSGATWTDQVQLSPTNESAGPPRIVRSGSRVAIVWTDQLTGKIYLRRSSNGGSTWSARQLVGTTSALPYTSTTQKTLREAFPVAAYGSSGAFYVAYYSASKTLRIRRSTDYGATFKTSVALATNAVTKSWAPPALAASSSTVLVGYATATAGKWTVMRRSTDKGAHWGSVVALNSSKTYWSGAPVLAVRGSKWMAAYERCNSTCSYSTVYYRASTSGGSTWGTAVSASQRKTKYNIPADIDVATKTMLLYVDYSSTTNDVYLRLGW